jgi:hypothetical protein
LLLNNDILHNKSYYTINTNISNILQTDTRHAKLDKVKTFRKTLDKIFTLPQENILEYAHQVEA